MPNFTFRIENCKIFNFGGKNGKSWGLLAWTDGTIDFEQRFSTTYQNVIEAIAANRSSTSEFRVSGYLTKNEGYGEHKGKFFNNWIVDKIEVSEAKRSTPKELLEAVKQAFDIPDSDEEVDSEIPF